MMYLVHVQGLPFLACLAMLAILGYIGIHVLKREVIFIDIALAQIAAVGAIAAHVVFHFHDHSLYAHAMAIGFTLIAAVFFATVRHRVVQIPLEAVIGVSYAVSAAAALFLVGVAPGGHVHVQEMLAGSILWATKQDVLWSSAVFAAAGVCFYLFRRPFRMISEDYEKAASRGYNVAGWDFLFYALVGVVITMAVRIAGVVVVFTFLIIPATLSAMFAHGWAMRLVVAWVAGAVSTALGLLFADRFDFSVGPAIALFLGGTLIVTGLLRFVRVNRMATTAVWLVTAVALGAWFASGITAGESGPIAGIGGSPQAGSMTHAHDHDAPPPGDGHDAENEPPAIDEEWLSTVTDLQQLESAYANAGDAGERCAVASRMLEVDAPLGVHKAIEFLSGDPPLLFRLTIRDKLEEVSGQTIQYDIDKSFAAPANQEAVTSLVEAIERDLDDG